MLDHGTSFSSPGGSFRYEVIGSCCRLFDREELPWPSCSLAWKGRQPSWRRIGRRFVEDISTRKFPSYSVKGTDRYGSSWEEVRTDFTYELPKLVRRWWHPSITAEGSDYPEYPTR